MIKIFMKFIYFILKNFRDISNVVLTSQIAEFLNL